ncbi:MAG TPA: hypothetical protein VFB32_17825 [Rudaea sp.]|nr:hypothetical protein [Rudaea sp.]
MGRIVAFVVTATIMGFLCGLLSGYLRAHGQAGIPPTTIATISLGFATVMLAIASVFAGNRRVAAAGSDEEARAKTFAPDPNGASTLYVFRDAFYAKFLGLELFLDGSPVGQTRGKSFLCFTVAPGAHRISTVNPQDKSRVDLDVDLAPGPSYVEQSVKLGATGPKHALAICDAANAQPRIRRCRLLASQ